MKTHDSRFIQLIAKLFLQTSIVLVGAVVLGALIMEPQLEGRNANSSFFQTYFADPLVAFVYLASVPFFVALYQAFKGLEFVREGNVAAVVKALRMIRYCALIIAGSTVVAGICIRITAHSSQDDAAGAVMLGVGITFVSFVVAAVAVLFERMLQSTLDVTSKK